MPGHLRSAPGSGVDGRPGPLVRFAAGPRAVPRTVPGASCSDHAVARGMAGRDGRGETGVRVALRPVGPCRGGDGLLPAGRAAPAAGRVRGSGGGVPADEPLGPGTPARAGAVAAGARSGRGRGRGGPHRTGGRARPCRTSGIARRVCRHPAGRRRRWCGALPPTSWRRPPLTSARRSCARCPPRRRAPSCWPRATPARP